MYYVQQPLFTLNQEVSYPASAGGETFTPIDIYRMDLEESGYTRWYCVKEILTEQYLWDMRCWDKPKYQYTKEDVMEHIRTWIKDHEAGNWANNCGHCLYCIRKLLAMKWASLDEISGFVLRNNNITYSHQVGTWSNNNLDN